MSDRRARRKLRRKRRWKRLGRKRRKLQNRIGIHTRRNPTRGATKPDMTDTPDAEPADEAEAVPEEEPEPETAAPDLDADEAEPEPHAETEVAEVKTSDGATRYTDIKSAWDAAKAAKTATVTLLADVEPSARLMVAKGENITFDGRGYTLSYSSEYSEPVFSVEGGILTISSGIVKAIGKEVSGVYVEDGGTVNITGGTVEATGEDGVGMYILNNSIANITGGTVKAVGEEGTGVSVRSGEAKISGGTITAVNTGVGVSDNGTISIAGGTVTAGNTGVDIHSGSTGAISGGTITASEQAADGVVIMGGTAEISGGTVAAADVGMRVNGDTDEVSLSGGTFTGGQSAVSVRTGKVSGVLENFGGAGDPHCAFLDKGGKPFAVEEDALGIKALPGGTFTVEECGHNTTRRYTALTGGAHRMNCAACGYKVGQENCKFETGEPKDADQHTLICTQCGNKEEGAHAIALTAAVSGTVITLQRACSACGYTASDDVGKVTLNIPALVYGEALDGKEITWETDAAQISALRFVKIDTLAGAPAGGVRCEEGEFCPLTALAGNNSVLTAGTHTLYVEVETMDADPVACAVSFTVTPAGAGATVPVNQTEDTPHTPSVKQNPQTGVSGEPGVPDGTDGPRQSMAVYALVVLMGIGAAFAAARKKKENER